MVFKRRVPAVLAAFLIATAAAPTASMAQETDAQIQSGQYDSEDLRLFAVAYLQVEQIGKKYATQFKSAETDTDRQQVVQQAQAEMVEAIQSTDGMTVEQYNAIAEQAKGDPALAKQISEQLSELR